MQDSSQAKLRVYVRSLNDVLARVGRDKVWHSTGYAKARALHDELDESFSAEERAAVLRAHDLFIAARDGAEPPASTEAPQPKVWKMEGRGFMLTYNKKKWSCAPPELFAKFLVFFKQLVATLGISKWTATIEKSLNSKDEGRVHMHAYVEWAKTTVENLDERFDFESQRPRADNNWFNTGQLERLDVEEKEKVAKRANASRGEPIGAFSQPASKTFLNS